MGEAPGVRGFFVGAGFNSVGIASAGGAGRALAEWVVEGEPTSDLVAVDIRRFAPFHADAGVAARPGRARSSGCTTRCRGPTASCGRRVPSGGRRCYDRLAAADACFGSKMGWERANVFAPPGEEPVLDYTWGKPSWLPWSAAEQRATRAVGGGVRPDLVLEVPRHRPRRRGGPAVDLHRRRRGAGRARSSTPGCSTARGTYEADLTVTRVGRRRVPAGQRVRDHRARPGLDPAQRPGRARHRGGRRDRRRTPCSG